LMRMEREGEGDEGDHQAQISASSWRKIVPSDEGGERWRWWIKLAMSVGNQIIMVWWDQRVFVELADFILVSEEIFGKFCACCLLFFSCTDRMQCVWVGNGLLVDTGETVMAASKWKVLRRFGLFFRCELSPCASVITMRQFTANIARRWGGEFLR
jgi:hypothetical protein